MQESDKDTPCKAHAWQKLPLERVKTLHTQATSGGALEANPGCFVSARELAAITGELLELKRDRGAVDVEAITAALNEVEHPAPIPVGAPDSATRRAWELGVRMNALNETCRELEQELDRKLEASRAERDLDVERDHFHATVNR